MNPGNYRHAVDCKSQTVKETTNHRSSQWFSKNGIFKTSRENAFVGVCFLIKLQVSDNTSNRCTCDTHAFITLIDFLRSPRAIR